MMKRYLLSIILGFLALTNISLGQVEINFASQTANTNGTVDIDLTANGFTDISVLQFSAGWDSLVMNFNSVVFTNPDLTDLAPNNISGSEGASNVDPGQFSFSYSSPFGTGNLDDGDILFTVRFDIVGNECDETLIQMTEDPLFIECFDKDFNELTVTSQAGTVSINGTDCGGGGGDELTITAETLTADMGTNVCVSLNVENFIGVQSGSGTILWDPEVIMYTEVTNANISTVETSLNTLNVDNGELKFVWSNPDPGNPLTIPDGEPIFDICFDVIGEPGEMSPVTLSTAGSLGFEWTDDNDDVIPQSLVNGKVTVTEPLVDPVTFTVSDITVNENDTNVCVDISVENFTNILATQFVITWDDAILGNPTPANFNLPGLNTDNNFNIDGNCATFSWSGINGTSVADETIIFSMCFDAIADCEVTSVVDLVSKGSTNIEVVDGNTDLIDAVLINPGSITIGCGDPTCEIVSIDNTCVGTLGGNVTVNVPTENCTYSWANSSGVEVSTSQNLLGVAAGTYFLTVTCDGAETCTLMATIENFDDLFVSGEVTDAGCGPVGAIDVTVTMGSGDYSYNWNPTQDDSPNISGLDAGSYALTVTDETTGCTKTAQFSVENEIDDLEIVSSVIIDETCVQDDGRITITVEGGCEGYSFEWSDSSIGNTPMATGLTEGTYQVTVTDSSSPPMTVERSYTVEGADPIIQVGSADITPSFGTDGAITIDITGGNPDYDYNWSGPTTGLPNSNTITGLMPGMYSVTVTDSDGCQATFGPFEVIFVEDVEEVEIMDVGAVNDENGFAILCNGDANGSITGFISGGASPFTVELSGDESRSFEVSELGTFTIDNLEAGTYTVTVSNEFNSVSEEDIEVTEPDQLSVSVDTGCDNEEQCDGFIDLDIEGGAGDYTFEWSVADLSGASVDDLCQGSYTVVVSDDNGCEQMESIDIDSCQEPNAPCYEVRDVITPNGDGMNDQFSVTCINDFPASLEIYDRWGKLVFDQSPYDGSWMGMSNSNEELIEGGYMYIININFGEGRREIMKGTLTLLRD